MKPAGFTLLCFVAGTLPAAEPGTPPANRLSSHLTEEIRASLPKYQKPPETPAPTETVTSNPDVLELPKMTVTEKRPQVMEPDTLMSKAKLERKKERTYLNALADESELTYLLNSFNIPFLTPSVAQRANEAYFSQKMASELSRLSDLADRVRELDSKEADKLKRDLDLTRLPGK